MAEGSKSGGVLAGLGSFVQQWQVIVAAIAAVTALWFGFADQRRKELEINRQAVVSAKAGEAGFVADPHNTIVEFRATYPEHAFCAALGYFVAEAGRQASAGPGGAGARVKNINDAIGAQIERIADAGGLTLAGLDALATAAAGDGTPGDERCPTLRARFGLRGRIAIRADCRLLVETYAQAQCQTKAAELDALAVATASAAGADRRSGRPAASAARPGGPRSRSPPVPLRPGDEGAGEAGAAPGTRAPGSAELAPGAACGSAPPTVYLQFTAEADRPAAEQVRKALEAAGWSAPGIELVAGARTSGDVRFYWADQEECARGLAAAAGRLLDSPAELATISLAGRYRSLPRGRVELWLPAGVAARD